MKKKCFKVQTGVFNGSIKNLQQKLPTATSTFHETQDKQFSKFLI